MQSMGSLDITKLLGIMSCVYSEIGQWFFHARGYHRSRVEPDYFG